MTPDEKTAELDRLARLHRVRADKPGYRANTEAIAAKLVEVEAVEPVEAPAEEQQRAAPEEPAAQPAEETPPE